MSELTGIDAVKLLLSPICYRVSILGCHFVRTYLDRFSFVLTFRHLPIRLKQVAQL